MKIKNIFQKQKRSSTCAISLANMWDDILVEEGYVKLTDNPEIVAGARVIADLISSMTIHLMTNTDDGDKRIVNELSRKVDINPCNCMTRKTWMDSIIMNLLLYGKGNSVVLPITNGGILENLIPCDAANVRFVKHQNEYGYDVVINNITYPSDDVIHFVLNPDPHNPWMGKGLTASLKDLATNLKQASRTEKEFMSSKWKPSIIVKVDGMIDEFSSPDGRKKLIDEYLSTNTAGEPWLIPADQFQVEQIRPLSLADLAINQTVELDKKTVASILGVPAFVLGVGTYTAAEWNNFISAKIRPMAISIQQELTKKLLISPKWYWKFNMTSLYSYDIKTLADVYSNLYVRGIVDGNEVREKMSMSPREGLNELVVLENYIPLSMIGDQKKLNQEGEE